MSMKIGTYTSLVCLIILGIFYLQSANKMSNVEFWAVDQGYLPKLLAILLIILCLMSFYTTWKKEEKKVELPNLKYIFLTIGVTILYLLSWRYFGNFYLNTFLFIMSLLLVYRPISGQKIKVYIDGIVAIGVTAALFLLFGYVMNINF